MPVSPTSVAVEPEAGSRGRRRCGSCSRRVPGLGVHADEERRVATLLQELRVARPLLLHDPLAVGVELIGDRAS